MAFREQRDATLAMPNLILPSVQVNMRAGELPPEEGNGMRYLKLPLNAFNRAQKRRCIGRRSRHVCRACLLGQAPSRSESA